MGSHFLFLKINRKKKKEKVTHFPKLKSVHSFIPFICILFLSIFKRKIIRFLYKTFYVLFLIIFDSATVVFPHLLLCFCPHPHFHPYFHPHSCLPLFPFLSSSLPYLHVLFCPIPHSLPFRPLHFLPNPFLSSQFPLGPNLHDPTPGCGQSAPGAQSASTAPWCVLTAQQSSPGKGTVKYLPAAVFSQPELGPPSDALAPGHLLHPHWSLW